MCGVRQLKQAVSKAVSLAMAGLIVAAVVLSVGLVSRPWPVIAQTPAVDIQRVSVPSVESDNASLYPSISGDGRYVALQSDANNLVPNDNNGVKDIFVRDRQTGEIARVSVASDGTQGDGESYEPTISADGRHVAFYSYASNLVASDNNGVPDVFVHDRQTGETTRVSVDANGDEANEGSFLPSISADGRHVAFTSYASNLVAGDSNGTYDIFVRDRQTGQTTRVNVASNGDEANNDSNSASISADGRYVVFGSFATNLVVGDTNSRPDVFVHDRQTGQTTRVSVASNGDQSDYDSTPGRMSAEGRYVTFCSNATNLVAGDDNDAWDVFVHDRQTGQTTRVSVASGGAEGNGESVGATSIGADGRYVAFESGSSNLVAGDSNGMFDIFVHDRETGETSRVSVATDNAESNGECSSGSISADGNCVAFVSGATNIGSGDTNGFDDIFVHDRQTAETTRVSAGCGGEQSDGESMGACVSGEGRYVAFHSFASNLVAGDSNDAADVFVRDRWTGETTRVSVDSNGIQGDDASVSPSITPDGRFVAFSSAASNLVTSDNNGVQDVFVHDRQTGLTTRVSLAWDGAQANGNCLYPSISADGRYVGYISVGTNLVETDTNGDWDVFVRDRTLAETTRVSVDSDEIEGNGDSWDPSISADGRYVAFYSYATNLVDPDTNAHSDVFVRDLATGTTARVSLDDSGGEANSDSLAPSISADGRYVAFESYASDLVTSDTNGRYDIFVYDRQLEVTTRVSVASGGAQSNGDCYAAAISGNGQYVAFESDGINLITGDTNSRRDVFVHDRQSGETQRLSVAYDGGQSNGNSYYASISADGRYVAFESDGSYLVPDDSNGYRDAFLVSWMNPLLAYAPTSIDFGSLYQGYVSIQTLQVQNSGEGTLTYSLSENSTWCSAAPDAGDSVGETDNVTVSVDTSGLSPGSYSTVILIASDGGLGVVPVHLSIQAKPVISVVPSSHGFGTVALGGTPEQVITVSNSGAGNLVIGMVAAVNPLDSPFSIVSDNCSGQTVLPGDNSTLTVRFSPTVKGSFSDSFDIPSNDPDTPSVAVTLSGATPNTPPPAPVVDVTPDNPTTTDDLVCSIVTQGTDVDGDPITYTYQWYKDDVLQPTLTTNTVGAAATAKGQVWKCVVTPYDGMAYGVPPAEGQVTVQNSIPTAPVVAINPASPGVSSNLVCGTTTASTDADSDTITYAYQWYKDGALQSSLTTDTVPAANTALGEVWRCVVTPSDGTVNGPSAEDEVAIQNSAPAPPMVDVMPNSPTTADDLVCNIVVQSIDAEGDAVTYTYQWYKDGVLQPSLTTDTVGAAETAKGQVWKCVVTPSDGVTSGTSGEDEVAIQNSAPKAPVVAVTPDKPGTGDDLVCSVTTQSTDADGDTVTYTYQWYKDGEVQSGLITNTAGATQTARGQVWKCVVTPNDGTANGATAQDEVTVTGSAGGFPAGAIAGIVIGVLVLAAAGVFLWFRFLKKPR